MAEASEYIVHYASREDWVRHNIPEEDVVRCKVCGALIDRQWDMRKIHTDICLPCKKGMK